MVSDETGRYLVRLSRRAVEQYLSHGIRIVPDRDEDELNELRGVFVTIRTYPDNELRGCIGYPRPYKPLARAVVDNAIAAAVEDPRFPPMKQEELDSVTFEVTVLTVPELIKVGDPSEYPKHVKIGKDGLIIEYGLASGLLLPQVPVEYNWTPKEFLENLCMKAGLPRNMWLSANVRIYKFQGEIFEEKEPNGEIVRKRLFI